MPTRRSIKLVEKVALESDPWLALQNLLHDCMHDCEASSGRLYLLNLSDSSYECAYQFAREGAAEEPGRYSLDILEQKYQPRSLVESAIVFRRIQYKGRIDYAKGATSNLDYGSCLAVPIVRKNTCLGVFDLCCNRPDHFSGFHEEIVEFCAEIALLLLEKGFTSRLVKRLPEPIDLQIPNDDFLEKLVELVGEASGMPFIVLRELTTENGLRCLTSRGFGQPSRILPDICPIENYPPFNTVLGAGKTVAVRSIRDPDFESLKRLPQLSEVRSFVLVPIKVGQEVFGTISYSAACEYDYTELEKGGFETIANAVGVSISNYRAVRKASEKVYEEARVGAAIAGLEVAQAARHQVIDRAGQAHLAVDVIESSVAGTPTRRDIEMIRRKAQEIDGALDGIIHAIQNIKTVTKPPAWDWQKVSLRELWEDTFGLLQGHLDSLNIKYTIEGSASVEVAPDYLKQVFWHLIRNSIDAFKDRKVKSNRLIQVVIDPKSAAAVNAEVRYIDNAGGIDSSKLLLPPGEEDRPAVLADIFLPGVTSKGAALGSGYGLYLVERILKYHKGSIRLVEHRSNTVFDLSLPKVHPGPTRP